MIACMPDLWVIVGDNQIIMIERHYNLSCYVMEDLISAEYSDYAGEVVNFIDSNHDIYEFKLAEPELYEVCRC